MITIRNAREDETETLTDIGLRAWEKAMAPIGETAAMRENARSAFTNFVRTTWLTINVAEKNGTPAGWAAREALDENITDFWVDPAYERQGIGAALLDETEKEIVRQGFSKACLETHAQSEALSFFEKRGYTVNWLTIAYSPKLDRDIQSVGLSRQLVEETRDTYGPDF
jgi:ribosomal-protein-alanine N-acetyltransferase